MFAKTLKLTLVLFLVCLAVDLEAGAAYGGAAGSYLRLGVGARAQALGGAYSAVADDPQAAFWNPAGLVQYKGINLYSQRAFLSYGRKHSFFNYTHAVVEDLTLALSWLSYSGGDDLERRVGPSLEPLSYFSESQNCYLLSAGYRFHPQVFAGANIKTLTHRLDDRFGWGFGFDLGLLWRYDRYRAGLVLRDVGARVNWRDSYQEILLMTVRSGWAVRVLPRLLLSTELSFTGGQTVRPHFGAEVELARELSLQAGYDRDVFCGGMTVRAYTDWADYHFGYVIGNERMVGAALLHRVEFRMKFNAFDYYMWK